MIRVPPYTVLLPIPVSESLLDDLIGRPIYCDRFEIQPRGDGLYDLVVTTGSGDSTITALDWKPGTGDA